jgi:hypothetical protein
LEDAIDARTKLLESSKQHLTSEQANNLQEAQVGEILVPPKYKSSDFQTSAYCRLRGMLDVPKKRFVSYPYC